MSDSMAWFVAAGALVILELFTSTFYLLMIALGVGAGGVVALSGAGTPWPAATAAVVGVLATLLLRRCQRGKVGGADAAHDPNVNLDIGQRVVVATWQGGRARVMYRGALWDVELAPGADPVAGQFTIRAVRGSCLIVD